MNKPVRKVVIAGGGTAGWVCAAALSSQLGDLLNIVLVESEDIGTVGVGEASIPPMRNFHRLIGVDEQQFMAATGATFKLGIAFENWARDGDRYIHSFGKTGKETWMADFQHFWLRAREQGFGGEFGEYCVEHEAAREGKFAASSNGSLNYAYHLDATRYAAFLRTKSESEGVTRIEGKIQQVHLNPDSGYIESLEMASGESVDADLFIDCTGFRGLLIEEALHTGYEDWSHWLPCDSALAVQTESVGPPPPYTLSSAHDSGWRWRIPLQHRVGNGLVYCSRYSSDEAARDRLLSSIEGKPLTEPRLIRFRTGRRRQTWNKNCVAVGLSSGFVEPLESTSIHLIMISMTRLIQLFPFDGITPSLVSHYNQIAKDELEKIRDFIILHYHATERSDSPFWRHCSNMSIPESLQERIALFREQGHAYQAPNELFRLDSWVQVMLGQRINPERYHPIVRAMGDERLKKTLDDFRRQVSLGVEKLPPHGAFVEEYCRER